MEPRIQYAQTKDGFSFSRQANIKLKGFDESVRLFEVKWQEGS